MGVRIGSGLSTEADARFGAAEAAAAARDALGGRPCDLAVVFAAGAHLAAPEATLEGVHETLGPQELVGCGAAGVIGEMREVEEGTAVSVWAAALDGGSAAPFHAEVEALGEGEGVLSGLPDLAGAAGALLLSDPFTFPTDAVLRELSAAAPMLPLLGGLASARSPDAETPLLFGDDVVTSGAVGVRFDGVEILPCVSQGASPIGPELTITAAEGPIIGELAGRPALEKLRETIEALPVEDLRLVQGGLLMGIVIDPNKPEYVQGDFLVRGLVGADPDTGQVAVGTDVRAGQVVRLHARDAASADRDLRAALGARMRALGGRAPAGALLISCNGRGAGMFGQPHHDATAVDHELGGAPAAGFFAAGEIGPVGGEYFVHGFTATIAVFA
jgi:small ligand-binding sensory domain FIST